MPWAAGTPNVWETTGRRCTGISLRIPADLIYSMTQGGPAGSSNIITSYMMQLVQSLDYGLASAVGVLCILFLIVFAAIYLVATKYTDEEA